MGTLLMQENPEVGIELPLKALIYKDDEGRTWVLYKDMNYLKDLYFLKDPNHVIDKMNKLQAGFKKAVINPIKTTQITEEELK
jgi:beta-galactosidase